MNLDEKTEQKIKSDIVKAIKSKVKKTEALKKLGYKYKVSQMTISNLWIEVKEEKHLRVTIDEPKKAKENPRKRECLKIDLNGAIEDLKTSNAITPKKIDKALAEGTSNNLDSAKETGQEAFKNVSEVKRIDGEYGTYFVCTDGVVAGDVFLKDLNALEEYENAELKKFSKQINEIKKVFEYA